MTLRAKAASTVYLLRHAHSVANERGILAGQASGISLSTKGKAQAEDLVLHLEQMNLTQIHLSPLQRCQETVEPFLKQKPSMTTRINDSVIEMNYGDWTGKKLSYLSRRSLWKEIQAQPSTVTFPQGESFLEMQHRAIVAIEKISNVPGNHLVVSHGDVIRVILNHYLGAHLDEFQRITVDPASISSIRFHDGRVSVQKVNSTNSLTSHAGSALGGGAGKK